MTQSHKVDALRVANHAQATTTMVVNACVDSFEYSVQLEGRLERFWCEANRLIKSKFGA